MRRNLELIRDILEDIEANCSGTRFYSIGAEKFNVSKEELDFHCRLVQERGLAKGTMSSAGIQFSGLTWEGMDFLDDARNPNVWRDAIKAAGNASLAVFQEVMKAVAKALALKSLGL